MKLRSRGKRLAFEGSLGLASLIYLAPLAVLINVAVKTPEEAQREPLSLASSVSLENFQAAWDQGGLGPALVSSTTVAALSVGVLVLLGSTAAYYFARTLTRASNVLYFTVLVGVILPVQLGMVPLYQLMSRAGLLGTYTSLIIYYSGILLPFTIFLYAGFMRAMPRDFEEAATLDGAGWWRTYWLVVFPLVRPITVTVALLNAIDVWKDFMIPLLYVGGSSQQTLPVAIYAFRGEFVTNWGIFFAGVVISVLPVLLVYVLLQRFIIGGFAGGLKG